MRILHTSLGHTSFVLLHILPSNGGLLKHEKSLALELAPLSESCGCFPRLLHQSNYRTAFPGRRESLFEVPICGFTMLRVRQFINNIDPIGGQKRIAMVHYHRNTCFCNFNRPGRIPQPIIVSKIRILSTTHAAWICKCQQEHSYKVDGEGYSGGTKGTIFVPSGTKQ